MAENNSDEIVFDFPPLFRHYKDGRIQRPLGADVFPPSLDPTAAVQSKDVQISTQPPISARLFLPSTAAAAGKKLPLLIYFHGGCFIAGSPFNAIYHSHLTHLVSEFNVVAVSVDYRLAPETPLPAAYDDAWTALNWVASNSADDWITRHADLENVYFAGDSAGGNIAHNTAVRHGVAGEDSIGIKLKGIVLNCPYFWGEPEDSEKLTAEEKKVSEVWRYTWPGLESLEEGRINPAKEERLGKMAGEKVVVFVGGKDVMKGRGWKYKTAVEKSGWKGEVEVVEAEGEGHVYSLLNPAGENSVAMFKKVAGFINSKE